MKDCDCFGKNAIKFCGMLQKSEGHIMATRKMPFPVVDSADDLLFPTKIGINIKNLVVKGHKSSRRMLFCWRKSACCLTSFMQGVCGEKVFFQIGVLLRYGYRKKPVCFSVS